MNIGPKTSIKEYSLLQRLKKIFLIIKSVIFLEIYTSFYSCFLLIFNIKISSIIFEYLYNEY